MTATLSSATTPSPGISVLVCAYADDRWAVLGEAIASVLAQEPPPRETLVVIDHNAALLDRVRAAFPQVLVLANAEGQGLSGARNTGIANARGDVVAFLDDDAVAQPGWLAALTRAYADPAVVGTGGVVEPCWRTARPGWMPEEFLWVVGCTYRGVPGHATEIRNPIGANMSLRREACLAVGGFATGLGRVGRVPLGCEETEIAIRLRHADARAIVLQVPGARVRHEVVAERTRWRYFVSRCWSEGRSKAIVSSLVGTEAALAAERAYATRTLPTGVLHGLRDAARGDADGPRRALAIVAGLSVTAAGYAHGRISAARRSARRRPAA